jgi:hypothetical protein
VWHAHLVHPCDQVELDRHLEPVQRKGSSNVTDSYKNCQRKKERSIRRLF